MNTRGQKKEKLSTYVQGHSEAASNNMANLWNQLDLKSAGSFQAAKTIAKKQLNLT